jgi:hypothetical protein
VSLSESEDRTMMASEVPDRLSVKSPPYTGVYQKRPGSRRDRTLFCWFNIEDADDENDAFPHVSLHIEGNNLLDEIHVTFKVLKGEGKHRFANYYKVDGTKVTFWKESTTLGPVSTDDLMESGRYQYTSDKDKAVRTNLYRGDADAFAQAFVNAAATGQGLPPYVPTNLVPFSPFANRVPPKAL